jgi:hypothetical protein
MLLKGMIGPVYADETITADGSTLYTLTGAPLAIVGVYKDDGASTFTTLKPAQAGHGRIPTRNESVGDATVWSAHGAGSSIQIGLYPVPATGTYSVRYIPEPDALVTTAPDPGQSDSINCPAGFDDRIVLGMARRALIKEGSGSAAVDRLIAIADEDLAIHAHSRMIGEAPRVRNRRATPLAMEMAPDASNAGPDGWWWI